MLKSVWDRQKEKKNLNNREENSMGKKKTGAVPVAQPSEKKKMTIDMNEVNRKKAYTAPAFRTGRYMTEKDRPRKKNWKREYERGSRRYDRDDHPGGPFFMHEKTVTAA